MSFINEKLARFFKQTNEFQVRIDKISSTEANIYPEIRANSPEYYAFASEYAPRLGFSGGTLINPSGNIQSIEFYIEYPNPVISEPNLIVDIYVSNDDITYTLNTSSAYDSLPITVNTNAQYVMGIIRTNESTPRVLFTTKDIGKGYLPLDVRKVFVDLSVYGVPFDTLKGEFPIFVTDFPTQRLFIDTSYRSTSSYTDSTLTIDPTDTLKVFTYSTTLSQYVISGQYYDALNILPKSLIIPPGSVLYQSGDIATKYVRLEDLVDTLVLLSSLNSTGSWANTKYSSLLTALNGLQKESTTGLFYEEYDMNGQPTSQGVDIAANVYLAARFLSSEDQNLKDFVLVPVSGQNFLDKIATLVSTVDGTVVPDYYDSVSGTYTRDYTGFTEGTFYILERIVEELYQAFLPSVFDSASTLSTLSTYVDLINSIVYASMRERDGNPSAPERRSIDLAALYLTYSSVPVTPTEDYSQHASLVATDLQNFVVSAPFGVQIELDPNNANYNPYWLINGPISGMKYFESSTDIDTNATLLTYWYTRLSQFNFSNDLSTDDGLIRTTGADPSRKVYVAPALHATVLEALINFGARAFNTTTYTVYSLNSIANNVIVSQTPTSEGVYMDITLDYPAGIVVIAMGNSSGVTYDSVIITNQLSNHGVYLRIPQVTETIQLHVIPIS